MDVGKAADFLFILGAQKRLPHGGQLLIRNGSAAVLNPDFYVALYLMVGYLQLGKPFGDIEDVTEHIFHNGLKDKAGDLDLFVGGRDGIKEQGKAVGKADLLNAGVIVSVGYLFLQGDDVPGILRYIAEIVRQQLGKR